MKPWLWLIPFLAGCTDPVRYDPDADGRAMLATAQAAALAGGRHLMVVFGAEWCPDCRKLHDNLTSREVRDYLDDHMDYVTIDVGNKDRNLDLAANYGVTVANGIPVAVFFDGQGQVIGTTNQGQLEPSRYLSSRQILKFVRTIVEERKVSEFEKVRYVR